MVISCIRYRDEVTATISRVKARSITRTIAKRLQSSCLKPKRFINSLKVMHETMFDKRLNMRCINPRSITPTTATR